MEKTISMCLPHKSGNPSITTCINGRPLRKENDNVDSVKFLGIHIDSQLKWRKQVSSLAKSLSQKTAVLWKLSKFLPSQILTIIYNAIIHPHLTYCASIWGCGNLKQLFTIQKSAVRAIGGKSRLAHTDPLFHKFGILKVQDIVTHQLRIDGYMAFHNKLPLKINSYLVKTSLIHNYCTRKTKFALAAQHSAHSKKSVVSRISSEWNLFAEELESVDISLATFKKKSKLLFLNEYGNFTCMDSNCQNCNLLQYLHKAMPSLCK